MGLLWTLVARALDDGPSETGARLLELVAELDPEDQRVLFQQWCAAFDGATTADLRRALFVAEGTGSLDAFADFRSGLILMGKTIYEAAVADPDSLADVLEEDQCIYVDSFGGRLRSVLEPSLGEAQLDWGWTSVDFDEDEEALARDFPRLVAKLWE